MAIEKRIGAYSAYAIAVKHGFVGTEEEWLESLIGPIGYQGWGISAVNVSADGSLIFTVENPETGETRELEPIQIETLNALNSISTAKDEAVNEVKEAQTQATEAVGTAGNQALQDISDEKTSATGAVNTAGENAVNSVNSAGQAAVENAQTAITAAKNQAVSGVESAGQSAVDAVGEAQTAGVQAIEDAQTNAVQAVQDAGTAEAEKISSILPVPTEADAGKVPVVKPDGSGYELGSQIDDAKTSLDTTWSSESIISRICPHFEVSGSVVTCNPVEGSTLNTVVQIEPVQEGTGDPSPENVRPIRGWNAVNVWREGKNLWGGKLFEAEYTSGIPYIRGDNDITFPYTPQGSTLGLAVMFPVKAHQTFTFKAHVANENATYKYAIYANYKAAYSYENVLEYNTLNSDIPFVVSVSGIMVFMIGGTWKSENGLIHIFTEDEKFQLEFGDTSTPYEPYRGETFTIPLGQIVYGGTLDVNTGLLTTIYGGRTLTSSSKWMLYNNEPEGISFMYNDAGDSKIGFQTSICSHFKNVDYAWHSSQINVYGIFSDHLSSQLKYFRPPNKDITTIELFKEWLDEQKEAGTPVQLMYKLAEPITVQLTPQEILALSGVNTVYADAGDITVTGYSDPTAIINSLADRIAALEHNAIGG